MTRRLAIPKALTSALAVSLAVLAIPQRGAASPYKVTIFDQGASTYNAKLNNAGQVAGYFTPLKYWDKGEHVFFYDSNPGGQVTVAGITLPTDSQAGSYDFHGTVQSLNNKGHAVGFNRDTDETLLFDARTGAASSLPISWESHRGNELLITDSGAIYGTRRAMGANGYYDFRPTVHRDGAAQDLDIPPGMVGAKVLAANDLGRLLVAAALASEGAPPDYNTHKLLFDNGRWSDISDLTFVAGYSGRVMNANGDIVGSTRVPEPQFFQAALVPNGGQMVGLGALLPEHNDSMAAAINSEGSIVGMSGDRMTGDYRGFLYQNGVMTDLNDLVELADGWLVRNALTINDRGQILAQVWKPGEGAHLALLTPGDQPTPPDFVLPEMPVPEPSTWVVFALAAVGLGCREAKRRNRTTRGL